MAGGDGRDEPNLELPSFFGRRKKRQAGEEQAAAEPSAPEPVAPEPSPDPAPAPTGGLRPAARPKRVPPPRREQPASEQPAATQPIAAPAARREPAPEPVAEPVATPTPVAEPVSAPAPEPAPRGPEMTYAAEPTTVLTAPPPDAEDDTDDSAPAKPRRSLPSVSLPRLHPRLAAAVGGAVAALVGVVLAWLSLRGCEAVRGVSSCGGGPGLLLLVTVVVAEVLVGAAVLRALGSDQPAGTSLVGVGLVVVLAMFFPAVAVTSVAAAIVLPVATALTFVLAHVAATTVVDLGD